MTSLSVVKSIPELCILCPCVGTGVETNVKLIYACKTHFFDAGAAFGTISLIF